MHIFDIIFSSNQGQLDDRAIHFIESHLVLLNRNGQLLGKNPPSYFKENRYHVIVEAYEKHTFDSRFNSQLIDASLQKAKQLCIHIEICYLGSVSNADAEAIQSVIPSAYILFTHFLDCGSPIRCFDTFDVIPLYHLPKINHEQDYDALLNWQTQYQACDTLQMNCEILEGETISQMADVHSKLSRNGRGICNVLSSMLHKPVYYYLYQDDVYQGEYCPGCGALWAALSPPKGCCSRICYGCYLITNHPF